MQLITTFESEYADLILNNLYTCIVPDTATLTEDYILRYGVHSTGFKDADAQLRNRKVTNMVNIPTILTYYLRGIQINIPSDEDKYDIHKVIVGYLNEWRQHLGQSINLRVSKHEEMLKDLEELASNIYDMLEDPIIEKHEYKVPEFTIEKLDPWNENPSYERSNFESRYGSIFDLVNDKLDKER